MYISGKRPGNTNAPRILSNLCLCFQPFSIVHYGAACGVVVTASHNPKQDNGYKVNATGLMKPFSLFCFCFLGALCLFVHDI